MYYNYDLHELKEKITEEQIFELLEELGGEPIKQNNNIIVCKTICHCGDSHKLYFYFNSKLCHCYTGCSEPSFDIFELTRKVMSREHPKPREKSEWNLPEAIEYIAQKFGFSPKYDDFEEELVTKDDFTIIKNYDRIKWVARKFGYAPNIKDEENEISIKEDLTILSNYDRIKDINVNTQEVELKEYDDKVLKHLPHNITITPWLKEGITKEVMDDAGICYNPVSQAIVIPHYDINNRLIGIRERTLVEENAELYGKYRPAYIGGKLYNHPLSFNLYNLNNSKDNIRRYKKAFIFEGEKSTLLYRSYFGKENDISTAICGSSFIAYQCWLLINCGAEEIIVALDKQYKELGDDEHKKLVKNLKNIHKKYGAYVKISYLFDKGDLLDYKNSPTDKGVDVLLELYNNKFSIY